MVGDEEKREKKTESGRGRGRRSLLYREMRKQHDRLVSRFDEEAPNWPMITERYRARGFTNIDGQPLSSETTRKTWASVKRDVKARRAKPAPIQPAVQITRPASLTQPAGDTEPTDIDELDLTPTKMRR